MNTSKKTYFEWMRIIAIFLVIFNHLAGYGLYMVSSGYKQAIYMTITMITRINVPLFFMISGALLLAKEESVTMVIKKRIVRFGIVLLLFSLGLYIGRHAFGNQRNKINLISFFRDFLSGKIEGSYWYLYAYIGFLFMLPFMQRIAQTN